MVKSQNKPLILPFHIVGRVDVGRLLREAQALDEFLRQAAIREPGTSLHMPKTSRLLDEFLQVNDLNALQEPDRKQAIEFLERVRAKAPVLHMSFSTDPSASFTNKLVEWIRQEIHPHVLLSIGMQPNLGVGAIVRTTNNYFDLSLRKRLTESRQLLVDQLHGGKQS
jgi:hypothetical protein